MGDGVGDASENGTIKTAFTVELGHVQSFALWLHIDSSSVWIARRVDTKLCQRTIPNASVQILLNPVRHRHTQVREPRHNCFQIDVHQHFVWNWSVFITQIKIRGRGRGETLRHSRMKHHGFS